MITNQLREAPPSIRAAVTVTFLRMERPPTVPFYRYLYGTVGAPYLWWLRRAATDEALAAVLGDPSLVVCVLYQGGEPAGFFELDTRPGPVVNLAYFGLMPHATGRGLGTAFLRAAVDAAWACGPRAVTVNTCTADHPRALPGYLKAGFQPVRTVREVWDIPNRLGLVVPPHLRA